MLPETCVPTSTFEIGSTVPVAVMVFPMLPMVTASVSYTVSVFLFLWEQRLIMSAASATAATAMMMYVIFLFICDELCIGCYSIGFPW